MTKKQVLELLESLAQQATNRLADWGIKEATVHIVNCPNSNGLHIQVRDKGYIVCEFHIWDEDDPFFPDSEYEQAFLSLCQGIKDAEAYWTMIQKQLETMFNGKFGPPPPHGGVLN